ncbi:MAG: exosome complex RNA-binding protein Csl4 [archaeon]|nr:exosome complex RNA-binding protein Csl4 [archaeon]
MTVNDGDFVMPGDAIGIIEQYLLGEGTYDDEGDIKSSVLGNVKIDSNMKTISVEASAGAPGLLKIGDSVYGQITNIRNQRVNVKVDRMKDSDRPLALPYMAAINISKAKDGYLNKLTDAFRIGDIIQAKVDKITGDNIDLRTTDPEDGVVKAICTRCRGFMYTTEKENEVQCYKCNRKELREVSINYVNE